MSRGVHVRSPIASAQMPSARLARLVVQCRDRPGIVAAVARFLADRDANITSSAQHSTDPEGGWFFLRLEFDLPGGEVDALRATLGAEVAQAFGMQWRLARADERQRVALLASREEHCLLDLLWRRRRGELRAVIVVVIANPPDHRSDVEA